REARAEQPAAGRDRLGPGGGGPALSHRPAAARGTAGRGSDDGGIVRLLASRRKLGVAGGLLGVVIGAVMAPRARFGGFLSSSPVALETVEPARFVREVSAEGVLEAVNETPITVPMDVDRQQKIAWLATDGASVRQGDTLVEFDPFDARKELTDGQADRDS